jgi:hypothetical protein
MLSKKKAGTLTAALVLGGAVISTVAAAGQLPRSSCSTPGRT